jgi:hypothetical protein
MAISQEQADGATRAALSVYEKLPQAVKPLPKQFNVLAACVLIFGSHLPGDKEQASEGDMRYEVISLGLGTKCVGPSTIDRHGTVLRDSHAEVRRCKALSWPLILSHRCLRAEAHSWYFTMP